VPLFELNLTLLMGIAFWFLNYQKSAGLIGDDKWRYFLNVFLPTEDNKY
jgi:hypothetical protein